MPEQDNEKNILTPDRVQLLFDKALDWIGECERGSNLYETLHEVIGLTHEEITASGFDLKEYYENEETDEESEI